MNEQFYFVELRTLQGVVEVCPHKHRRADTADRCAKKMIRRYAEVSACAEVFLEPIGDGCGGYETEAWERERLEREREAEREERRSGNRS